MKLVPGTQGYAAQASSMDARWERLSFHDLHDDVAHLLPREAADVLDVGAGSGRDAAALAGMGHRVVAVEPVDELRAIGQARHASSQIVWVDDSLPGLHALRSLNRAFDLVMLTAVWMHLDTHERERAMRTLSELMRPRATLLMTLRHGPVPAGRHMFDVPADETIALANACGLQVVFMQRRASVQESNRESGVVWTRLAFSRASDAAMEGSANCIAAS